MTGKDYFVLGCKLLGIYSLFYAIRSFFAIITTFVSPLPNMPADLEKAYMLAVVTTRLIPFVYIAIAIYLIKGSSKIYSFAYSYGYTPSTDFEEKFTFSLKILGVFLIISYFPDLLRTISAYLAYSGPNGFLLSKFMQDDRATFVNAASGIWGVAFGFYLLKGGKFIVNLALKSISEHKDTAASDND